MKICVVSDLHMEIGGYPAHMTKYLKDGSDVLVIAGDLTCARYFHPDADEFAAEARKNLNYMVEYWFPKFRRVYYVMGNHEHYGSLFRETADIMRKYLSSTNVMVLDDRHEIIDDVLFVGGTLWTDFNNHDRYDMQLGERYMNDYNYIYRYTVHEAPTPHKIDRLINADFIYDKHKKTLQYIRDVLRENNKMKTVVITHHAPSEMSQLQARSPMFKWLYTSNLESVMHNNHQIAAWIHGHTHDDVDYIVGKTRVFANQRGYYPHEPKSEHFRPKYIEV